LINGRTVKKSRACVSVFDNSLFYAEGLFETLLAIEGRAVYLEDHLDRLEKGAALINLDIPCSRKRLRSWIKRAIKLNGQRIVKVRVTATAGDSAFWAGRKSRSRIIIIVTDYEIPTGSFRLGVSPFRVDQGSPFRNVKTLSFVIEMTSRKHAYSGRLDDHILLNRAGYVAEATSANIFWIKGGRLFTTPLASGCLDGMTRKHVMKLAGELGIKAAKRNIRLNRLVMADEIFISSSLKLIMPVRSIRTDRVYRFPTGPITSELKAALIDQIASPNIIGKRA